MKLFDIKYRYGDVADTTKISYFFRRFMYCTSNILCNGSYSSSNGQEYEILAALK